MVSDGCAEFDLILLNTGPDIDLCLALGTLSALDLSFCSQNLAVYLE
jgi:hypothetical protein